MENKQEKAPQMTSIERNTLSKIIEKHIAIIEDKKTKHGNKNIPKQKTQLTWSEIAKEFNESDVGPQRTAANLKKAYENMKAQAKRNLARVRRETNYAMTTGGGPPPPEDDDNGGLPDVDDEISKIPAVIYDVVHKADPLDHFDSDSIVLNESGEIIDEPKVIIHIESPMKSQTPVNVKFETPRNKKENKDIHIKKTMDNHLICDDLQKELLSVSVQKAKLELQALKREMEEETKARENKAKYWELKQEAAELEINYWREQRLSLSSKK